jgi:hypothetical protein
LRRGKAGAIAHGSGAVIETHARLETIFPAVLKPLPLPLRERPQRFSLYFSVDSIDVSVRRLNKHPPETMNARLVVFRACPMFLSVRRSAHSPQFHGEPVAGESAAKTHCASFHR